MESTALFAFIGILGFVLFVIGLFAVLARPLGSVHGLDRRHDDWGPDAHRTRADW